MKRNDYSNYSKGQEISGVTFQQHQNQVIESINSIMLSLGLNPLEATILFGLEATPIGAGRSFSEGALFVNGEIFQVDTFTTDNIFGEIYLTPKTVPVGSAVRFGDGILRAAHNDYKYEMGLSNAGSSFSLSKLSRLQDGLIERIVTQANTHADTRIDQLTAGASSIDTFAEVEVAVGQLSSGGVTSQVMGSVINYNPPIVLDVSSGTVLHLNAANVAVGELLASPEKPKTITVFCDMFYKEEGTADDFHLDLVYRIGTSGSWETIRRKYLRSSANTIHVALRGQFRLIATPIDVVQFGVRMLHDANGPVKLSPINEIEFDAIY